MAGLVAVPHLGWAVDTVPDAVMAPIRALNDALIRVMRAGKSTPFRARFHMLAPTIDRAFDLAGILLVSVGPRWAGIDAAQQTALRGVFRLFTVASYVDNFDSYADEQFEVAPDLRTIGDDQVVSTTLVSTSDDPIRIDYVMRREGVAWKVVDVMLDGTISRVAVQRSDFRGVLTEGGAPALIASLERKVADLSGGALVS
jgi:phospholipid transport system substrate-binding protein